MTSRSRRAIFLDRDGVINENLDGGYISKWCEFRFLAKAKEATKVLTDANWDIIIISNQAGVDKGIMSAQAVEDINIRMVNEIECAGGRVKAVYYCPHRPDENCECRKPKPGMLLRAAREYGVGLSESYLIGDSITDIQAGAQVGCATILVRTGQGKRYLQRIGEQPVNPDYVVSDLYEAVKLVLTLETL